MHQGKYPAPRQKTTFQLLSTLSAMETVGLLYVSLPRESPHTSLTNYHQGLLIKAIQE